MKLLIDAGNTLIKWALLDENGWVNNGSISVNEVSDLVNQLVAKSEISAIWVSNVAGQQVAEGIKALGVAETYFIEAKKEGYGVKNNYDDATQLGSDRWAALVAAWKQIGRTCLVVNSGTATTIDALSNQGEFLGGLIIPGLDLMQNSLIKATAALKNAGREFARLPLNTMDALYTGAIQATCGAIEQQRKMLGDGDVVVVLSGGAAEALHPYLAMPSVKVENLVLRGIQLIAQETENK